MKTMHPVKKAFASLFSARKHRQFRAHIRKSILHREESLNKIFMVRYKMGNM